MYFSDICRQDVNKSYVDKRCIVLIYTVINHMCLSDLSKLL